MEEIHEKTSPETAEPCEVVEEVGEQTDQSDRSNSESEEWEYRLLRLQADFDNYRKRVNRERLEERDRGIEEVIMPLLQIADNLTRAVKAAKASADYEALLKGLEMIDTQLAGVLTQFEVEPIVALDQPFNPNLHHAVMHAETSAVPENTVTAELQVGYSRKGRVLRPSMVQVAVNTGCSQGGNEGK